MLCQDPKGIQNFLGSPNQQCKSRKQKQRNQENLVRENFTEHKSMEAHWKWSSKTVRQVTLKSTSQNSGCRWWDRHDHIYSCRENWNNINTETHGTRTIDDLIRQMHTIYNDDGSTIAVHSHLHGFHSGPQKSSPRNLPTIYILLRYNTTALRFTKPSKQTTYNSNNNGRGKGQLITNGWPTVDLYMQKTRTWRRKGNWIKLFHCLKYAIHLPPHKGQNGTESQNGQCWVRSL